MLRFNSKKFTRQGVRIFCGFYVGYYIAAQSASILALLLPFSNVSNVVHAMLWSLAFYLTWIFLCFLTRLLKVVMVITLVVWGATYFLLNWMVKVT